MARKTRPAGDSPIDKFESWTNHLINASRKRIILVDKKKYLDVLKGYGMHHVYWVKKPFFKAVDDIVSEKKDCILLFSVSKKGNEFAESFKTLLQQNGVKVSIRFRKYLLNEDAQDICSLFKRVVKKVGTDRKMQRY